MNKREYPIYHKDESGHEEDDRYFLSAEEKVGKWKNSFPKGLLEKRERELEERLVNEKVAFVFNNIKDRLFKLRIELGEAGNAGSHTKWGEHAHTLALIGDELKKFKGTFSDLKIKDPLYYECILKVIYDVGY